MSFLYQTFEKSALQHLSKVAIIAEKKQYTYKALLDEVNQWAQQFHTISQKRQVRIALLTEDVINTASIAIAMAKINGTCVPTNPQLTTEQLINGWLATAVNTVIYEPCFSHKVEQCKNTNKISHIQFICTTDKVTLTTEQLKNPPFLDSQAIGNQYDDFIITLSSGSTGKPKPIVLSQTVKVKRAQQSWHLYNITDNDVVLCASPFFHSLGQRLFFVPLLLGATLVHLKQFTPKAWIAVVEKHKVSKVISVSSHLYALKDELLNNTKELNTLKTIVTSSAPIDAHFKEQLFQAIGCDFHEMYGATEVATTSNLSPNFAKEKHASVGVACSGVEIKILDNNHQPVSCNIIGEIAVKSPLAFSGYYLQPELTASSSHDGFFLTGDLGKLAEDGFLTYMGRKKEIIISGGINIYPKDIESVLSSHQAIREIAVIGVNDDFLGEVILAICVLNNTIDSEQNSQVEPLTEKELRRLANKKLAPFQRPLKYFFLNELPVTPSGKTSKLALQSRYNDLNEDWSAPLRAIFFND